jgi:L-threonylcarbamoyladenylate synthase
VAEPQQAPAPVDPARIAEAAALLRAGRLVAFPTETVYGLGASATDDEAIAAVFTAKGRPGDNPLIVHGADRDALAEVAVFDAAADALATAHWPGPLTLVLPARDVVAPRARGGLPSVAVRVPDHPMALALLRAAGPLVAPSANTSGRPSPTTAAHVRADLGDAVAMVLDGGPCRVGIESTVLDLTGAVPTILRPGALDAATLGATLGCTVAVLGASAPSAEDAPRSPGLKYRHYAPRIPVRLRSTSPAAWDADTLYLLGPGVDAPPPAIPQATLSAATLYAEFRRAEAEGRRAVVIVADVATLPPGLADRVRRASEH